MIKLNLNLNTNLTEYFRDRIAKINYASLQPVITEVIKNSISRSFDAGGRYGTDNLFGGGSSRWVKSKRATKQKGKTLQDTGLLVASILSSIHVTIVNNQIVIYLGSRLKYARIHQYGGTITKRKTEKKKKITPRSIKIAENKKSKSKTKKTSSTFNMPVRPFINLQNEDLELIKNIIIEHIYNELTK